MKIKNVILVVAGLIIGSLIGTTTAWAIPGFFANGGNSFAETTTLGTTDNFDLRIITNNSEKARLTTSGNLGLGTSSPTSKLHVVGTGNITGNTTLGANLNVSGNTILNGTLDVLGATTLSSLILNGPLTASSSTGTSGQVLTSNGSSSAPSWQNPSSGGWVKVTSGSFDSTTAVDITGLNISSHGSYKLYAEIDFGSINGIFLYVNNNTTATNYFVSRHSIDHNGVETISQANSAKIVQDERSTFTVESNFGYDNANQLIYYGGSLTGATVAAGGHNESTERFSMSPSGISSGNLTQINLRFGGNASGKYILLRPDW